MKRIILKNIDSSEKYLLLSKSIPTNLVEAFTNFGKNPVKKLLNLFISKGGVIYMANTLLSTLSNIYSYFFNKKGLLGINKGYYLNEKEFMFILSSSKYMLNISRVLDWILTLNASQFEVKLEKFPKKYKKKNKKKYGYKIQYLQKSKKLRSVLRWIFLINYNFNTHGVKRRLLLNILDLLLNFKRSILFSKKMVLYKNFLKL